MTLGRAAASAPPGRCAAALVACVVALVGLSGCGGDGASMRGAKAALGTFARDLRDHRDASLRARATCLIASEGVSDARLRRVEPLRTLHRSTLDSLARAYGLARRAADSTYEATPDKAPDVEERFRLAREWARREGTVRAAMRAALQSARDRDASPATAPPEDLDLGGPLESVRGHVTVRYAGPAVGPDRIDRDLVVRILRAPGGPWIVYAFDLASDSPGPIPF